MRIGSLLALFAAGWFNASTCASESGIPTETPGTSGQNPIIFSPDTIKPDISVEPRDASKPDNTPPKARIAVVPGNYNQDTRARLGQEQSESNDEIDPSLFEKPSFASVLAKSLKNSGRFDVIGQEELGAAIKEIGLNESDYSDVDKVVKIGQLLSADFVVIPDLCFARILAREEEAPSASRQQRIFKGKLAVNVRIVSVKTSKIVASSPCDVHAASREQPAGESPSELLRDVLGQLYGQAAAILVSNIMDTAYPIRIVEVSGNSCVLNRGEGVVLAGEELDVYQPGEMMIDPDTHENLGYHEARIGRIKVVRVDERSSTADILEGLGRLEVLYIARHDKKAADEPSAIPTHRERTP
ncbi:MAG: CsgG/HfaB family protein [Lentisphaerota bacterium]